MLTVPFNFNMLNKVAEPETTPVTAVAVAVVPKKSPKLLVEIGLRELKTP
jgi:hypothetical protein